MFKISRIRDIFLVFSLALIGLPHASAMAEVPPVQWTVVGIPGAGEAGGWVLAPGSDVASVAMGSDGTLYCTASPSGTDERLFRSSDNGTTWSAVGSVRQTVADIAVSAEDSSLVCYSTTSRVYFSSDRGGTFFELPPLPGGVGSGSLAISSIAVAGTGDAVTVFAAVRDGQPGRFGAVYALEIGALLSSWKDTAIGALNVIKISLAPDVSIGRQLVAVACNDTATSVVSMIGPTPWGMVYGPVVIPGIKADTASICFPPSYRSMAESSDLFVGIGSASGTGGVYRITQLQGAAGIAADLSPVDASGSADVSISSLTMTGGPPSPVLVAGARDSSDIFSSGDLGKTWKTSAKPPTGGRITSLLGSPGQAPIVFAATSGTESAFSLSDNGGTSWDQISLIDTRIDARGIVDFAPTPDGMSGFLLTWGGSHSLWRTDADGRSWRRVLCTATFRGMDSFSKVTLSPQYGSGARVVLVAGTRSGQPLVWKSSDAGNTFRSLGVPFGVDAWAVASDEVFFIAGYDGAHGLVSCTGNGGLFYSTSQAAGNQPINSVALSPSYAVDRTVVAGNTVGETYASTDNGTTFRQLGSKLPVSTSGIGRVNVAFDVAFKTSRRVYASVDAPSTSTSRDRLFCLTVQKGEDWEGIDATLPVGSMLDRIAVSQKGTLYVADSRLVSLSTPQGGMRRSLDAGSSSVFETAIKGLGNGASLHGLWLVGHRLWSLDTAGTRLMTFIDTLESPAELISPADNEGGVALAGVDLDWKSLDGATSYEWQVNSRDNFSDVPPGMSGICQGSSASLAPLQYGETYFWRVRATAPLLSPWSERSSFTTRLGANVVAPQLLSPSPGEKNVPLLPAFQWTAIDGAEAYDVQVSASNTFKTCVIDLRDSTAVMATAWQSDTELGLNTTYYWKVRAVGGGSTSAWSAVGVFTVGSARETIVPSLTTGGIAQPPPTTIVINNQPADFRFPLGLLYVLAGVGVGIVVLLALILVTVLRRR